MTTYRINEIFYSIQGEGYWTGRPAVFCRFSQCNLWSGREQDRATAICNFCDTNFVDYQEFSLAQLVNEITLRIADSSGGQPMVIFTGGEPLLQLDHHLVTALRAEGFYTALETNGTLPLDLPIDWVCVSPKTPTVRIQHGNELKLVYPQQKCLPDRYAHLDFDHFWISPIDGPTLTANTQAAYFYCLEHPQWRLNIQTHKVIGAR